MGTSIMYNGRNRSPLLPSDFDDGIGNSSDNSNLSDVPNVNSDIQKPEEEKEPEKTNPVEKPNEHESSANEMHNNDSQYSSWRGAKSAMSKYVSGKGGSNGKKRAVSSYVKSYGGARNAAKSAKSGIRTTINIGDFFGGISRKGIIQVLKDYNIQIEGRKPKEILNDIVNVLASTPNLNDDSVARKAFVKTMVVIYEKFEDEERDILLLNSLDPDISKLLITKYIETFIYERLIHDVGSRIEKKAENSCEALRIEKDLKEYIESKVSTTLKDKPLSSINSQAENVDVFVEKLYYQCYKVLEDQL
jgi:hypothetical protein